MFRRFIACFAFMTILAAPALAQYDSSDALVRLNRMETQFRQLSGQVEQLQFENRQLKDQLRKFQEDVEFRFQENRGGSSRPATTPSRPAQPQAQQPQRRGDLYDPSAEPEAPGAPRQLGSAAPSAPLSPSETGRPMPLPGGEMAGIADLIEQDDAPPRGSAPLDMGGTARTPAPAPRATPSVAATGSNPQSDYEIAYAAYSQKQYEEAEMGFRKFLQSNPRSKLVPDAAYWLGESYLQRSRYREAAEQFLNVSADHPNSNKAPDSLLKLGISLNAMGARDRACAVYSELDRKYPQASANVRQGSEREQKRAKCA